MSHDGAAGRERAATRDAASDAPCDAVRGVARPALHAPMLRLALSLFACALTLVGAEASHATTADAHAIARSFPSILSLHPASPAAERAPLPLASLPIAPLSVVKPRTPEKESDPGGGSESLIKEKLPDSARARIRGSIGYTTNALGHDLPGFRSDSILTDPLERFGRGYQAVPGDFTRDNLKLMLRQAPPDHAGEITTGTRMLDGLLGVTLTALGERSYRYSEGVRNYDASDRDNRPYLIRRQHVEQGRERGRYGATLALDAALDASNRIELSLTGLSAGEMETRILDDSNYVSTPTLNHTTRTLYLSRTLGEVAVAGRHSLGLFGLTWRGAWSGVRQSTPDQAELGTAATLTEGRVATAPVFTGVVRDWQRSDDLNLVGGADLSWTGLSDLGLTISGGGLFRRRTRENERNVYRLIPVSDSLGHAPAFTSVDTQPWDVLNAGGSADFANNNYTSEENVGAGYLMGSWKSGAWSATAGARVEATSARYATFDPNELTRVSATKDYVDVLPGATLRYAVPDGPALRLAVGTSITRPRYYDLVPYNYISGEFRYLGNPKLLRSRSIEGELRVESAPGSAIEYSAGPFVRRIADPIETVLDLSNPALPTIIPRNLGDASLAGLDFAARIGFLDYFGAQAAYTYTWSSITSDKLVNDRAAGTTALVPETRPMQGEAEHAGALAVTFDRADWGASARLSLVYTGRRLRRVSIYRGFDYYEQPAPMLGFSIGQRLAPGLRAGLRVENLLDTRFEVLGKDDLTIEREELGQTMTLELTYQW